MLFGEVWDGVERGANTKIQMVKVQNDIRTSIYTDKQTSPIFNCVTPVSVSLATLARQLTSGTIEKSHGTSLKIWDLLKLLLLLHRTPPCG